MTEKKKKTKGKKARKASENAKKTAPKAARETPPETSPETKGKVYLFDNPKNVKRLIYALVAVCVVALGLDFFVQRYVDHPWEAMFGFYALYGFVMCVFLVLAAKELRKILMRKEDYYDE